jgi:DNA gyrase subunit A
MMTAAGYIKTVSCRRVQDPGPRRPRCRRHEAEGRGLRHRHHPLGVHAYLLFFSNRGRVYRLKAHQIPMMERTARGTAIVNLLQLQPDERIQAVIDTRDYETNRTCSSSPATVWARRRCSTPTTRRARPVSSRSTCATATSWCGCCPPTRTTRSWSSRRWASGIRFAESDVRPMGRDATGVRAMKLKEGDRVVSADVVAADHQLLVITDEGFGKRTDPGQFRRLNRGAQGIRAIGLREGKGKVVAALMVGPDDQLFLIADSGVTIRVPVSDISEQGRDASGVRVMNLDDETKVVSVARVLQSDEGDEDDAGEATAGETAGENTEPVGEGASDSD